MPFDWIRRRSPSEKTRNSYKNQQLNSVSQNSTPNWEKQKNSKLLTCNPQKWYAKTPATTNNTIWEHFWIFKGELQRAQGICKQISHTSAVCIIFCYEVTTTKILISGLLIMYFIDWEFMIWIGWWIILCLWLINCYTWFFILTICVVNSNML